MFSKNALGADKLLGEKYKQLTNQYRENVVPYTRLQSLKEAESGRMLPKNAVQDLLKDDQFMIELSKRYPGLFLHTPKAKKAIKTGLGIATTIGGYEGIKKLLR